MKILVFTLLFAMLAIQSAHALTLTEALKYSDNKSAELTKAAQNLVDTNSCSLADINENGGWTKSTKYQNTWFIFCGGLHQSNKIYYTANDGFWGEQCTDIRKKIKVYGEEYSFLTQNCRATYR